MYFYNLLTKSEEISDGINPNQGAKNEKTEKQKPPIEKRQTAAEENRYRTGR
ncbi:TPA: hypothetical protein WHN38_001345 [Neisseria meningitidis]|uniref:hypothetical protein n=1 Tax=Neisseria meningitidis TaxID=487 RepID=UPI001314BA8D|nr:hypothetical protein [Neisseria meningitidis]